MHGGAIANAGDLQLSLETFDDSGHDIGKQRAIGAPHCARTLGFVARLNFDFAASHLGLDVTVQYQRKRTFRPLYVNHLSLHRRGDAGGYGHRFVSNSRHGC